MNKKRSSVKTVSRKIVSVLSHYYFFIGVVTFFFLQMLLVALFSNYPMLFDEEYHLGIIDIYSRQWLPFIITQPPEAAFHGDITRYGSYLFHYIMSFPYRVITLFTNDIQTIMILLRLICIGFVIGGVIVFRKFLLTAGVSRALTHTSIAVFTLIPLVPFALSQLNYDTLAFLLIPSILLLAIKVVDAKKHQTSLFLVLIGSSMLSSLVKFTILPIAFASVVFCLYHLYKQHDKKIIKVAKKQFSQYSKKTVVVISLFLVIATGLFVERYMVNIVSYRNIEPKCDQVHSRESCMEYTVWRRDTTWREANEAKNTPRDNPIVYTTSYWAPHIFNDFFVVGAFVYLPADKPLEIRYLPSGPGSLQASSGNPLLRVVGWVVLFISVILFIFNWKKIPHKKLLGLMALVLVIYTASLWVRNYTDYLRIGAGTAAQGRYFIPLLIPIFALLGSMYAVLLKKQMYKLTLLAVCAVFLSQGGGVANYILYSNPKWYWVEGRQTITNINMSARKVLRSFTPF